MNLSEYSSEVVGFDSTWDKDQQVLVKDAGTDVMENLVEYSEKSQSTNETAEIGVNYMNDYPCSALSNESLCRFKQHRWF